MRVSDAQAVRNFVFCHTRPFTTHDVYREIGVKPRQACAILNQLAADGKLAKVKKQGRRWVYVKQGRKGRKTASERAKIIEFLQARETLFTTDDVVKSIKCSYAQAKYHLGKLAQDKVITLVSINAQVKSYIWGDSEQSALDTPTRLWQTIKNNPAASQAELIKHSGLSRSAVERWLRVFRHEKIVAINKTDHNTFRYRNTAAELPKFKTLKEYGVRS